MISLIIRSYLKVTLKQKGLLNVIQKAIAKNGYKEYLVIKYLDLTFVSFFDENKKIETIAQNAKAPVC